MSHIVPFLRLVAFGLPLVHFGASQGVAQQPSEYDPTIFTAIEYRHIGPVGNRVSAVVGVPGDPNVYYIGAASGGIFKSVDGGIHWEPVFDDQPAASIGSLAVETVNPNVIWAGTGETFIRSNISHGDGIYKSIDAGKTWRHMGLDATGRIGRIVIHPTNPDIVFAAAMGHSYGPQQARGVFRTTDGGETWEHVLFVDEHTGASDIVMDPNNPRILFAGMWQLLIQTWGRESGGPGSGLWTSRDGGATWEELTGAGLPAKPIGKIGLAMTPDDSNRIYALIETNSNADYAELDDHEGVLWRSDDGGGQWRMVNADHALAQRPLYYTRAAVAPDDRDEIHFMSTRHSVSLDGGITTERGTGGFDNHDMWIDPLLPDRMIVGHDGGASISTTRGQSWWRPRLPIAQMYHAYTDNQVPYYVYGNRQDGPSARVPSNSLQSNGIPIGLMHSVGGCESGFAIPDPVENDIVWSGCYDGILERYDLKTGHARNVSVWPDNPEGWAAADLLYRFQWTFPIAISPHDHNRVYVGSQYVHMTTDGGQNWRMISPDLTTNDKSKQQKTGGLTAEDVSPTYAAVLFAISESSLEEGLIWTGSNDGLVHVTRNGGDHWDNVTANIPDLPPWGTVSNIEPSSHDAGTAYISVDFHQVNDFHPYIYKTTDYGSSWIPINSNIPASVFSSVHVVREDPVRPGLLYAGTENGVYVSFDDGSRWLPLQTNLPHAPVHWLTIQPHFNDLVVGTYGRGFWILDDITPLQKINSEVLDM
ncbi:MAG: sialidase, partial [Acidobacteriota bacterium]|nr:sialidase [Acidobacteriota bacterium]